jgi:hypothetical protein
MRAAAILGLGCSAKNLKPFQTDETIEWRIGMPAAADQADIVLLFGGDGHYPPAFEPIGEAWVACVGRPCRQR